MRDSERRTWTSADLAIRLVILVLAALLLMALQQTGRLNRVESALTAVTTPGQLSMAGLAGRLAAPISLLREAGSLQQRNEALEQLNQSLLAENSHLHDLERENRRLRELLAFAETNPSYELRGGQILARPIGYDSNNFLNYLMLDLGRRHGIEVGMPVVNDQGLIGRISDVNEATAKVLLITDPTSTVQAVLHGSRLPGVVEGQTGADPVMRFISQDADVAVGEAVLTSGMGDNFPKGLVIGHITAVHRQDFEVSQEAVIRPIVDFDRLELVMVVTSFEPLDLLPEADNPPVDAQPQSETGTDGLNPEGGEQQPAAIPSPSTP